MTDPRRPGDDPDVTSGSFGDQQDALVALLADAAIWEEPAPHIEDAVVAAIMAESTGPVRDAGRDPHPRTGPEVVPSARTTTERGGRWRPAAIGATLGVAAAMVLFLFAIGLDVVSVQRPGQQPESVMVALSAADDGPSQARADLAMQTMPDGLRIEVEVVGLPPAPEDEWYELRLLRSDGPPVSAGSFHLRGGGDRVVLWAGIGVQPDLVFEVSRQPQGTTLLSGRP